MSDLIYRLRNTADDFSKSRNKTLLKTAPLLQEAAERLMELAEELDAERAECDAQARIVAEMIKEKNNRNNEWPGITTK